MCSLEICSVALKRIQGGDELVAVPVVVREQAQRQQRHGAVAPARVQHRE